MRSLTLWLASIALIVGALVSSPARAGDTGVVNVTNSPRIAEGEEFVAVNPRDPSNIILGSNIRQPLIAPDPINIPFAANGTVSCGVWSSHDGGRTWSGGLRSAGGLSPINDPLAIVPIPKVNLPDEFMAPGNLISADQSIVFDRHGTAYFECVDFGLGTGGDAIVDVYKSQDGGKTWSDPVAAFSQLKTQILIDRPYIAIDDSSGPRNGTIYLTWETMFYQPLLPAVYARSSTDGGKTWGPVVRVDNDAKRAMWDPRQYPVVGPDGALYVVYNAAPFVSPASFDSNSDHVTLMVARSTDGGKSFTHSVVEPDAHRISSNDEAFNFFTELISAIAADPAHAGRVAVAWPDDRTGEARILLRYTRDGGTTWSTPVDVPDDTPGRGNQHDHIALTYLPDGRLVAVWRDRRNGGGSFNGRFQVFARVFNVSRTGVLTPGKTIQITTDPQPPTTGTRGVMPSEYLSATATPAGLAVAWDQLRGLLPVNVFRRVPLSVFSARMPS